MAGLSPQTGGQWGAQAFREERLRRRACAEVGTRQARNPDGDLTDGEKQQVCTFF